MASYLRGPGSSSRRHLRAVTLNVLICGVVTGIVVILSFDSDVIKNHAKDMCPNVKQLLFGSAHNCSRTSTTMNNQHYAIHHRGKNGRIGKRYRWWRVDHNVGKPFREQAQKLAHFI